MSRNTHRDRTTGRNERTEFETTDSTEIELANSRVTIETGPVGPIARVETGYARYYAGPLPDATVQALKEVAGNEW